MRLATRAFPQPVVAIVVVIGALLSLAAGVAAQGPLPRAMQPLPTSLMAAALALAVILGYLFPIHVSRSTKIYLITVPCFMIVALLPPALAATTAGLGFLGGEIAVCKRRRNLPGDVATAAGRLTLVAILASSVVHRFPGGGSWHLFGLGFGAVVLWAADWWTAPLVIAPMCRERPLQVLATLARQGAALEAAQYLMAVPGALIVSDQPWALVLFFAPTAAVYRHFKRIKELHAGTYQLLERLADTVDQRDAYTGGHSRRVAELCAAILKAVPLGGPEAEMIVAAARVHDVGKIDLPDHVLRKPGILTPPERALMQEHPERGAALLLNHPGFARMAQMVRHHHEAWDGSGYPNGLQGPAIPFGARVIAVADSYDAMTSDRPYRRGMSAMQATTRLLEGRGAQWDPGIVDALIRALPGVADIPATPHSTPVEAERLALALAR